MPPIKSTPFVRPSAPLAAADARAASRIALVDRGMRLNLLGLAYTSIEAIVSIVAGMASGSVSLLGFGIEGAIEFAGGLAAHWRLVGDGDEERREWIEVQAQRVMGVSLMALATYVGWESLHALFSGEGPKHSVAGIAMAAASSLFMPWLARAKHRVAYALRSGALKAQAAQARICAWLATVVLVGLGLNALLDWWWADAAAALVMVPLIVREGFDGLRGHSHGFLAGNKADVQKHRAPSVVTKEPS